jgi:hypothetical protein
MINKPPSDLIKKYILSYWKFIQKHYSNHRVSPDINYVYLLNEKYEINLVDTTSRRKYEVFNKKIYFHCKTPKDRIFLLKKLLLDYATTIITPLFKK